MNNITEQGLFTDLGKLKGAHNNLATKVMSDLNQIMAAVRQCAAAITKLEGRVAVLEQGRQQAPRAVSQPGRIPGPQGDTIAQAAAQGPVQRRVEVQPSTAPSQISSWPVDDEEDADLVE